MSVRVRLAVLVVAVVGFAPLLLWGVLGLPPFGHYRGPYGDVLNRVAVPERHVTDVVAAVNFDYRGVDTIGEEFILFTAVAGVVALLRTEREEIDEEPPEDERVIPGRETSDAIAAVCLALVAPGVLLGIYIVSHGHLTPGGGFQGGVVLAGAFVLVYLGGRFRTLTRVSPAAGSEVADAVGAGTFILIGLIGLVSGAAFLQDVLPLGPVGKLYSSGTIPLINLAVGLEVGAGFLLILSEFLRQTLQVRAAAEADQGGDDTHAEDDRREEEGGQRP